MAVMWLEGNHWIADPRSRLWKLNPHASKVSTFQTLGLGAVGHTALQSVRWCTPLTGLCVSQANTPRGRMTFNKVTVSGPGFKEGDGTGFFRLRICWRASVSHDGLVNTGAQNLPAENHSLKSYIIASVNQWKRINEKVPLSLGSLALTSKKKLYVCM